jgi:tetratricopeptide (TPR) repeat protein
MKALILIVGLFLSCQIGIAQGTAGYAELVEDVMPSIVLIHTFDAAGKGLKRGTGFCVAPGLFITNLHVIEGANRISIRTSDGRSYFVTLDSSNKDADVALLKAGIDIAVRPLRFAPTIPKVGERILVVGNPLGLTGTVSDGIVSAVRGTNEELIQITAPISQGSSGSPVINLRGDVIGVATMNLEGGQNLNFAVSSGYIQSLWPNKFTVARISTSPTSPKRPRSARWRLLNDENTTYDKQTLSKVGDIISVWISYSEEDGANEKVLSEINCSARLIRRIQSASYDNKGKLNRSSNISEDWSAIIPDSKGESYYEIFCKGKPDYQSEVEIEEFLKEGGTYEEVNNLPAAIDSYWKALRLISDVNYSTNNFSGSLFHYLMKSNASSSLERIYEKQNDPVGLEQLYSFLISKGDEEHYVSLAHVYKKHGLLTKLRATTLKGIKQFEERVASKNATTFDVGGLAELYDLQDQPQKAIALLRNGLNRFPDNGFLASKLGLIYNKQKRWKDCVDLIEGVLPNVEGDYYQKELLMLLRAAYGGSGDTKNAARIEAELKTLK